MSARTRAHARIHTCPHNHRQVELQSLALLASTGTTAPKTGHHTAEEELVREAVAHFFEDPDRVVVTPTTGGVNNVVQYLTGAGRIAQGT